MSQLQYVLVIPAGGGKTTLCSNPNFLDIDTLYTLQETQSTYDRINSELVLRARLKPLIPSMTIDDLRQRISEYKGTAVCLLVHTIAVAHQSGLMLKGVYIPSEELHEKAIGSRGDTGLWFARRNRLVMLEECLRGDVKGRMYGTWSELWEAIEETKLFGSLENGASRGEEVTDTQEITGRPDDESHHMNVLTSAIGCHFA